MEKLKVIILRNELETEHQRWVYACKKLTGNLQYSVVNITSNKWLDEIVDLKPDIILTKPSGLTTVFKQLYDERLMILVKELGYMCFPSLDEVLIYENKRYFSYWLKANKIPHPATNTYYFLEEAINYIESADFPLIGKVNIGASGSGVTILKNLQQAKNYVHQTFTGKGSKKRIGPNLSKGKLFKRGFHYIIHPTNIIKKLNIYKARASDSQCNFVILQEFIPHDFEWRVIRIGDSFFAHKKVKKGEKASGALIKEYGKPPIELLDFVKGITDKFDFYSQAVDIFESNGNYFVNEMQCIFGQSDPYQMIIDGKPGRYLYQNNQWIFEEGDFNTNESYDLRLKVAIELFEKNKK